ncbi:MAG: hypothetical protein NT164_03480 [Verrucomicrobiae bacterium]|nr:hypothetical protein [Verrucomicrobiae bacterium]
MNTDTPSPSAEEGAVSAPFEKLPKLNLPPKPVLATATTTETTPAPVTPAAPPVGAPAPATSLTPVAKPAPEPPPIAASSEKISPPPAPTPVVPPAKKPEVTEAPSPNKKRATLSMPLAMIAFVVAILGLIVQLLSFFHLF